MSSCCCLHSPCPLRTPPNPFGAAAHRAGEGTQLVPSTAEEVFHYPEYEPSRTEMDIALLREQYRLTKENQMRQNRVVVFRRGEMSTLARLSTQVCTCVLLPVVYEYNTNKYN